MTVNKTLEAMNALTFGQLAEYCAHQLSDWPVLDDNHNPNYLSLHIHYEPDSMCDTPCLYEYQVLAYDKDEGLLTLEDYEGMDNPV